MKKEELLTFYLKYRIYIFPIAVTLSSLTLIALVIYPQISNLLTNRNVYTEVVQKSQFLEVKAQDLATIDEEEVKRKLAIALTAFPEDKDYTEIIGLMQILVSKYGFVLDSLQIGTVATEKLGAANGFVIELQLQGSKVEFGELLATLEDTSRVMKIQRVERSSNAGAESVIKGNVTLNIYYAPLPANLGAIDTPVTKLTPEDDTLIENLENDRKELYAGFSSENQDTSLVPKGKANPFEQ